MRKILATLLVSVFCLGLLGGMTFFAETAELIPAEAAPTVLAPDTATLTGDVEIATVGGVTYHNFGNNNSDLAVSYAVNVDHAGDYYLGILYNIGSNTTRQLNLSVNEGTAETLTFTRNSNAWGDKTENVRWTYRIASISLEKGANTIKLAMNGTASAPMISSLTLWTAEEWLTANDNPTIDSASAVSYETGFDGIGYDVGSDPGTIAWDVDIAVPGTYKISVAYSTPNENASRPIEVLLNGTKVASINRPISGNGYGSAWAIVTTEEIKIEAGENTVAMGVNGSAILGAVRLELVDSDIPESQSVDLTVNYQEREAAGTVYSLDVTWEDSDFTFNYTAGQQGAWNPAEHEYSQTANAGWTDDDLSVKVVNHSNAAVNVSISIHDADANDDLTVTADKQTYTLATAENTAVQDAPEVEFILTIAGTPTQALDTVATATLTFAAGE